MPLIVLYFRAHVQAAPCTWGAFNGSLVKCGLDVFTLCTCHPAAGAAVRVGRNPVYGRLAGGAGPRAVSAAPGVIDSSFHFLLLLYVHLSYPALFCLI